MTSLTVAKHLCHNGLSIFQSFPHSWLTWFVTRETRQVSIVEEELLPLSEYKSSPLVLVGFAFVFCVVFCRSLFVLLFLFIWPLCCLSFNLRILITPFGIVKFFSHRIAFDKFRCGVASHRIETVGFEKAEERICCFILILLRMKHMYFWTVYFMRNSENKKIMLRKVIWFNFMSIKTKRY